jgi:hypothetical protein
MLSQQVLTAVVAVEKQIYLALTEVEELTGELAQAVERQDQVSVRMFLSLRQEEVDRLTEQKTLLRRQCARLPREDGDLLRRLLSGSEPSPPPEADALVRQVEKNRALLDRILRTDHRVTQRLSGVPPSQGGRKQARG